MKNPLVFFVGAAVAAIGVVAAATFDRWQDWPASRQTAGAPEVGDEYSAMTPEPETQAPVPKAESLEEGPSADTRPAEEVDVALEEAAPEPEEQGEAATDAAGPIEQTTEKTGEDPAGDEAEPERLAAVDPRAPQPPAPDRATVPEPEPDAAVPPSFDVVRLEDDGSLIAVGRAAPDAMIELLLDGEVIATTSANEAGEWLVMPDEPLPSGSHELVVEASDAPGAGSSSSQVIALAVPERPGERPLEERPVALGEPAQPPETEPQVDVAAMPEPVDDEEPAPVETAEAPASDTAEQDVALAPLPEPEQEPDAPAVRQPEPPAAKVQPEPPASEMQPEEQAAVELDPRVPEREAERVTEPLDVPLALHSVDYNDKGEIVFSGRADPGRTVRIYVDGRLVGEATAGNDGQWVFAGGGEIAPGRHTLRADLTDGTGEVYGRVLLPFVRAETREVAALVESRRNSAEEPGTAEAEPEPEPESQVVAEEPEPEPEPQAPVVAEEPEPEPEVAIVAGEAEPEPEAPMMSENVAPEPEQEAPVAVEVVDPVPEPDAPLTAEQIVPEPAREAPVAVPETAPPASREPDPPRIEPVGPEERLTVAGIGEPEDQAAGEVMAAGPGHVVIQPGNNLWRISRVIYGRGIEYTVIYQANRDQIRDPDLIYPGQIFVTPGVNPPKEIDPEWREPLNAELRQGAAE